VRISRTISAEFIPTWNSSRPVIHSDASVLITVYAVYRSFNADAFRAAAAHTEVFYGTLNTVLLLTSSI
jgi:hypothetical protein